ncbi:6-bladed beta-propeller [Parabacteroides sp. PF5-9]|uniref:6-bladed beta-propeller n=1 Tax=Parabacteroides sp. PF5-9 TaxID=1742404 RepID=UPI002473C00A|nr:6-bladed beta-propeller [Parabacteroides sp. PF5-9]MDH6357675.1 hypothetical protein [Parabacteroides sp. PF5-9]
MKYIISISIILLIILFSGCNKQSKYDSEDKNKLYLIDFEQCIKTEQGLKISEIADTIEYLELKTPDDIIITHISDINQVDDFLIIESNHQAYKFTWDGEFVKKIGRNGQGPGEYSMIFNISSDPIKKEIILSDSGQLLFYDYDGNFLRRKKWGSLFNIAFSNSVLWVSEFANNTYKYIAFALNDMGDTIVSIPNPLYGIKSRDEGTGGSIAKGLKMFYRHNGSLYLKGKEVNDTIYQLSGINKTPYVTINMGKYKLPVEYEAWYSWDDFNKHGSRYWGIPIVAEDNRNLYLTALRYRDIDGDNYRYNEENFRYIVYDKEKRKGFVTKNKTDTKITDDILGDPPIWPRWIMNDYYMNIIEPYELLDEIRNGDYTLSPAFEKQLSGFEYGTNQLIVLCRRKK